MHTFSQRIASISTHDAMRRRFLLAAILGSGAAASGLTLSMLSAARAEAAGPDSSEAALAGMARQLCPHEVPPSVYTEIMDSILTAAAADTQLRSSLDRALSALDAATGGDFLAANAEAQVAAMRGIESQPYFATIQGQVLPRVYNHPLIWKHIGYPGSSVEYGGYKDRGFNDIDWLPGE